MKLSYTMSLINFRMKFRGTLKNCSIDHLKIMNEELKREFENRNKRK